MELARDSLAKASRWMKKYADHKRRPLEFQVGEKVLLNLTPHIQKQLIGTGVHRALVHKYKRPTRILKKVGNVTYRLLLPDRMKIHPIFYVIFLRKFHENAETPGRVQAKKFYVA